MPFKSNQVASYVLNFNNVPLHPEVAGLPEEYALGLMDRELRECMDIEKVLAPTIRQLMDGIMRELEENSIPIQKLVDQCNEKTLSSPSLTRLPYCAVLIDLHHRRVRRLPLTGQPNFRQQGDAWGIHPFWVALEAANMSAITGIFQDLGVTVGCADQFGDNIILTFKNNLDTVGWLKKRVDYCVTDENIQSEGTTK